MIAAETVEIAEATAAAAETDATKVAAETDATKEATTAAAAETDATKAVILAVGIPLLVPLRSRRLALTRPTTTTICHFEPLVSKA